MTEKHYTTLANSKGEVMVASYETVDEVIKVVRHHVDDVTFRKIVTDLRSIKGNRSFEATVERLFNNVMNESRKKGPTNKAQ